MFTFSIRLRSCARDSSSQNTAGIPDSRERRTASCTQSLMGASLAWHARQMSPGWTSWDMSTSPAELTTCTVPASVISKVLSWEPYSSAFCAMRPTFGTVPMVVGSYAPFSRQSSITVWYTPA